MAQFTLAVEGAHDDAIARRLCEVTGHTVGISHVAGGKVRLDRQLRGYNNAARFAWWFVLRDLDRDAECAPTLLQNLLQGRHAQLVLRVPVRSVETWLIADRAGIATYLGISVDEVPRDPEQLDRPKRTLVDLARRSPRREIRSDMIPREGLSVEVGVGYTTRVLEFTRDRWNPDVAANHSDSLRRCLEALKAVDNRGR